VQEEPLGTMNGLRHSWVAVGCIETGWSDVYWI